MSKKNIETKIVNTWNSLSLIEKNIAIYLLDNPNDLSISKLAEITESSPSSITKFCQKIGYKGFKEFSYEYNKEYKEYKELKDDHKNGLKYNSNIYLNKIKNIYMDGIENFTNFNFDYNSIEELVRLIKEKEVYAFGVGNNIYALNDFKYKMMLFNKKINVPLESDEAIFQTFNDGENKIIILVSISGLNSQIFNIAEKIKKNSTCKIIFISSNENSKINKKSYSDLFIKIPEHKNLKITNNISNQLIILIFLDLVIQYYLKNNYDTSYEFWKKIKINRN